MGHSAAGPFVVHFALERPELVGGVVSVDATITNWDTFGYTRRQRLEWARKEMREVRVKYDNEQAWAKLNAPPTKIEDAKRREMYGAMWMTPPRGNVFHYWAEWLQVDVGSRIRTIQAPLLALYAIRPGDKTPAEARRARLARFERALVPDHVRVEFIEDAYHTVWERRPKAFDDAIARFVKNDVARERPRDQSGG